MTDGGRYGERDGGRDKVTDGDRQSNGRREGRGRDKVISGGRDGGETEVETK